MRSGKEAEGKTKALTLFRKGCYWLSCCTLMLALSLLWKTCW